MMRLISTAGLAGLIVVGLVGCEKPKPTTRHETTIETPRGAARITIEKEEDEPDKKEGKSEDAAPKDKKDRRDRKD